MRLTERVQKGGFKVGKKARGVTPIQRLEDQGRAVAIKSRKTMPGELAGCDIRSRTGKGASSPAWHFE